MVGGIEARKDEAVTAAGEAMYDTYMRYLPGCADLFHRELIDVRQFTMVKPGRSQVANSMETPDSAEFAAGIGEPCSRFRHRRKITPTTEFCEAAHRGSSTTVSAVRSSARPQIWPSLTRAAAPPARVA